MAPTAPADTAASWFQYFCIQYCRLHWYKEISIIMLGTSDAVSLIGDADEETKLNDWNLLF